MQPILNKRIITWINIRLLLISWLFKWHYFVHFNFQSRVYPFLKLTVQSSARGVYSPHRMKLLSNPTCIIRVLGALVFGDYRNMYGLTFIWDRIRVGCNQKTGIYIFISCCTTYRFYNLFKGIHVHYNFRAL